MAALVGFQRWQRGGLVEARLVLEADVAGRKPREPDGRVGHGLHTW